LCICLMVWQEAVRAIRVCLSGYSPSETPVGL
jgi:hypothetical protein